MFTIFSHTSLVSLFSISKTNRKEFCFHFRTECIQFLGENGEGRGAYSNKYGMSLFSRYEYMQINFILGRFIIMSKTSDY